MKLYRWVIFLGLAGSAAALVSFSACKGLRNECLDGIDNDGDGLVDAADPACSSSTERLNARRANCGQAAGPLRPDNPACLVNNSGTSESDDPACADRRDNDGDGWTDWPNDPGCINIFDDDETNTECADGKDNDGDGLVDWQQDPGCQGAPTSPSEARDPACSDGRDNDGDGAVDYPADLGCANTNDSSERNPQCSDGDDNDGDGKSDFPADPDCTSALADREAAWACGDGVDNDFDGLTDFPDDLGCSSRMDNSEINPQCSNARDDNGNGLADYPDDPGCASPYDSSESVPQCNDGLDNDQDGFVDYPADSACLNYEDGSEASNCSDGVDNDGDGLVDYPDDPNCITPGFHSEGSNSACSDGLDNDADGLIDYPLDPGCAAPTSSFESNVGGDCGDGIDNDGDGFIDQNTSVYPGDPACVAGYRWEYLDPVCNDNADNDGDGRADFDGVDLNHDGRFDGPGEFAPDPGCDSPVDFAEAPKPQCADGADNDGDGTADWAGIDLNHDGLFDGAGEMPPDQACIAGNAAPLAGQRRRDESQPAQCSDAIDNDGDGLIDYQPEFLIGGAPNPSFLNGDDSCDSPFDNLEL